MPTLTTVGMMASTAKMMLLMIDGAQRATIAGEIGWSDEEYLVGAGPRQVRWRYVKDISQTGGSLDSALVDSVYFIKHYTYESWSEMYFSEAQLADSAISGSGADPNENGLSNLLENAFASNSLLADSSANLPIILSDETADHFTYQTNTGLTDLTYTLQESVDMVNWTPVVGTMTASVGVFDTYAQTLASTALTPKKFFRVEVVKTELP